MISNVLKKLFAYSIVILLTGVCSITSTHAEEHSEEDRFDGSEFNASSFKDINFEKTDYKELRSTRSALGQLLREDSSLSVKESGGKRRAENGIAPAQGGSEKGPLKSGAENIRGSERTGPVVDLPGDWVPDKIDLTSNGGFTTSPDNGSPVPYRLNGHIDIERGRP